MSALGTQRRKIAVLALCGAAALLVLSYLVGGRWFRSRCSFQLRFEMPSDRMWEPPLPPGSYRLEIVAEDFQSRCDIDIPAVRERAPPPESWASCHGDRVGFIWRSFDIIGFTLPMSPQPVAVRVVKNGAVLHDGVVRPRADSCAEAISLASP